MNNNELATAIGADLRAAERSAKAEGAIDTYDHLKRLHQHLGKAFSRAAALDPTLDWDSASGVHTDGGGTPKPQTTDS